MPRKQVHLEPGTKLVGKPHAELYDFLVELISQLHDAHSLVATVSALHGPFPQTDEGDHALTAAIKKRAFYASAARIYPALYLEAYANFIATIADIQFRKDFDRFATHKKLALYVWVLANRQLDPKFVAFVKQVFKLRDIEVHQKPTIEIVGKPDGRKVRRVESSLYPKCTLITIVCSINKLVTEISGLLSSTNHRLPLERLLEFKYPDCHLEENQCFRVE